MKLSRPTFEEFISRNEHKIRAVVHKRLPWNRGDADDAYQEILLAIWKAWPKFDWSGRKGSPYGLVMTIAWKTAVTFGRHRRCRQRGHELKDDIGLMLDVQNWSAREAIATKRARAAGPPEPKPWVEALCTEDRALVDLATAIARSGRLKGNVPGYVFHMCQWLPQHWTIDEIKSTMYHWYHRMDNARIAWERGKPIGSEPRCARSAERERLLAWTKKWLPMVIRNVMDLTKHPHLRREHAAKELREWRNRCWDIGPDRPAVIASRDTWRKRVCKITVEQTVPAWIFSGQDDFRACGWFRHNWNRYAAGIAAHGWDTWENIRKAQRAARTRKWAAANPDTVAALLARPEVKARRRATARNWNRSHRAQCSLSHWRWAERKRQAKVKLKSN